MSFMSENWLRIRAEERNRCRVDGEFKRKRRIDGEFEQKRGIGGESMENLSRRDSGQKKINLNDRNSSSNHNFVC